MSNLNQMNITITKYFKYYFFVLLFCLISVSGFSTISENTFETTIKSKKEPPTIILAEPSQKEMTTLESSETIKAYVRNIKKKKRVIVRINGKRTKKFKFQKDQGLINIKAKLDEGRNLIEIIAQNRRGEVSEVLLITRQPLAGDPSIEIIKPSNVRTVQRNLYGITVKTTKVKTSPIKIYESVTLLTVQLENVEHREDIVVLVDGLETVFSYHASSGLLRADIKLEMGENHLVINAYNRDGKKVTVERSLFRVK